MNKAVSRTESKKFGSVAKDKHHFIDVALVVKDYYSRTFFGYDDNDGIVVTQRLECAISAYLSNSIPSWKRVPA